MSTTSAGLDMTAHTANVCDIVWLRRSSARTSILVEVFLTCYSHLMRMTMVMTIIPFITPIIYNYHILWLSWAQEVHAIANKLSFSSTRICHRLAPSLPNIA